MFAMHAKASRTEAAARTSRHRRRAGFRKPAHAHRRDPRPRERGFPGRFQAASASSLPAAGGVAVAGTRTPTAGISRRAPRPARLHGEGGALAEPGAFGGDGTAVHFHDMPNDVKANSQTAMRPGRRAVCLTETIERRSAGNRHRCLVQCQPRECEPAN